MNKSIKHKTREVIFLTISLVLTFEAALFAIEYFAAIEHLREYDPRKNGNLAGTLVFARPKIYSRGQIIERARIVRHLMGIGFQERRGYDRGTYQASGNALRINSRLPEFPDAVLTFDGNRIIGIDTGGRKVDRVEVEPETLVSFRRMIRGNQSRKMNVRREIIQPTDLIPSYLYDAVRSSEDNSFDSHNGIDEIGMTRGVIGWVKNSFKSGGGGSTITQQMVKNVVLKNQDRTIGRKTKEIMLAMAAERIMSKEEIFAAYANNCYLGHVERGPSLLGFAAAARELFGVGISDLTIAQAATLAAMLDKPEVYMRGAREGDYSLLLARRERVLTLMKKNHPDRYSDEMITDARAESLEFIYTSEREPEKALDMISKQFQNFAANRLIDVIGSDSDSGNAHIFTTLEPELQIAAHAAVIDHLERLDQKITRIRRNLPSELTGDRPIQGALVAMDAQGGEILAMVGGRDSEFNYATARRSPGSTIKPFVYLQAIAQGRHGDEPFTAATVIDPLRDKVDNYRPEHKVGGPATAREHLARSDNGAAVVAAHDAGLASVRELIGRLTGSYSSELTGMLAIGGSAGCEVSALNLAEGYSIFPNNGLKVSHTPFAAIYRDGSRVKRQRPSSEQITDGASAFVVTQIMRSVLKPGGTAPGALNLANLSREIQIGAKTGTGQVADLWFVAFSKRLIVVVWVGMPDNKPALRMDQGMDGSRIAMPIWASFIKAVKQYRPDLLEGGFEAPPGVKILNIDPKRGCINEESGFKEYFIEGRQPGFCR